MKSVVRDMFALDHLNSKQAGGLFDLLRNMLDDRGRDIERDSEQSRLLMAVLTDFCDQIDHLWDSHEAALTLIDSTLTQFKALQATTDTPELKSA